MLAMAAESVDSFFERTPTPANYSALIDKIKQCCILWKKNNIDIVLVTVCKSRILNYRSLQEFYVRAPSDTFKQGVSIEEANRQGSVHPVF